MNNKEYDKCLRCGRKLKSAENRLRGYGETCWKKVEVKQKKRLFNVSKSNT